MPSTGPYAQEPSQLVNRQKRRGVALSCAECRRLKLKCSRQFPCSNCVKKGCSAICPDGSLTTGKGNRFVLANTETLHDKINVLANRVRHLEDALSQSHSLNSNDMHPLLADDLLQLKRPLERERVDQSPSKEEKSEAGEAIDALGSLSISQSGRSTFFGTTANSWIEEGSDEEDASPSPFPQPHLPKDLPWLSQGFPFTSVIGSASEAVRASIITHIPPIATAQRTCDLYFRHAAWMYTPITEKEFYDSVFRSVYTDVGYHDSVTGQTLSLFFMVLAMGALLDLDLPTHSPEAMGYYQVARAALSLDSILEEQTVTGIQTLLTMCHFMFLSDMGGPRWVLMGIIVKIAQGIGLHRDSGKWKLNPEETQKRRELFYEILTYDSWQSLTFGRPPSLATAHIDCKLPHETTLSPTGEVEMSFAAWKHKFSAECLSVVHDQAFGTKFPTYSTIQELDKKVRNWYVPPSLMVPGFGNSKIGTEVEQPSMELTMQRYVAFAIKEITLFYMHRGFFAQALEDNSTDPMGSKYASSVFAAHRSAMTFVALIESLFKQHPRLTERMWFLFTHVFSCAIVLGSIAVKSRMQLAPGALSYLDLACHLFAQVSDTARTGKVLPILQKLKERAHAALASVQMSNDPSTARPPFYSPNIKTEEEIEATAELCALGGMTRLVARRSSSSPSYSTSNPSSPEQNPPSPPLNSHLSPPTGRPYTPINESSSTWHNYTHIQNMNVNINVGDYAPYPSAASNHSPDMNYGYNSQIQQQHQPQVQQQQQQQQHHQHQTHQTQVQPHHQQSAIDSGLVDYYNNYNNYTMQMTPVHDVNSALTDMDYSWHNLVAQYRS